MTSELSTKNDSKGNAYEKGKNSVNKERMQVLSQLNRTLRKRVFAHHPDCDQYDRHVFKFAGWVLCVGDAGVYSAILLSLLWYMFGPGKNWQFGHLTLFSFGILFFIPAVIQLFWKSKRKTIKFMMRFSLGISIYYLLRFTFSFSSIFWKLFYLVIFVTGTVFYTINNSKKHLYECASCPYGELYPTCLRRNMGLLIIDGLEMIQNVSPSITNIIALKNQRIDDFERLKTELYP